MNRRIRVSLAALALLLGASGCKLIHHHRHHHRPPPRVVVYEPCPPPPCDPWR